MIYIQPPVGAPPQGYHPRDAYLPPGCPVPEYPLYPPPPPQGYPPQGYPPPLGGYPPQYAQQPPSRQDTGLIEGCLAALCCCCLLDACF